MAYDDEDDLNKWLSSQQAPQLEAAPAPQQEGAWSRAAKLLGSSGYGDSEPAPKTGDISWKTVLGMVLSKDPGAALMADADAKSRAVDAWAKRHSPEAMFDRQQQLAGMVMQEDAAKRAQAAQDFQQERAMANDIEQAANTDWQHSHTEGRDKAQDQHWSAEEQRARDQMAQADAHFSQSQAGMDRRNAEDNQRALEAARIAASVRTEQQQALAETRAAAAAARQDAQLQREYNDFRNKNTKLFDLAQAARNIDDVWARAGKDKPGAGTVDSRGWMHPFGIGQSDDDMAVRANFKALQEYLQNKVTGASAPKDQAARIAAIAGAQDGATEQQAAASLNVIRENLRQQLKAAGTGREAAARKVLDDMGLGEWVYGKNPATPTPQPAAAAPPSSAQRLADIQQRSNASPGGLIDTGGRKDVPPIPTAEPGDLGPPTDVDMSDWKKRYERYKLGGQP